MPIITVCPTNQTNLTALELFGYNGRYNLHSGHGNSWGKLFNLTFEELKKDISDIEFAKSVKYYDDQLDQNSIVDLFYLPYHGYCREITQYNPTNNIWILSQADLGQGLQIFVTNKNYKSYFSLDFTSQKGNPISISYNENHSYDVEVEVDSSCNIRKEAAFEKHTFAKCVDDELQRLIGKPMGCIPPWMSLNNQCNDQYPDNLINENDALWKKYIFPTLSLRNMEIEKKCRTFCSSVRYTIQLRDKNPLHMEHRPYWYSIQRLR